jgi:hypothetical protein
MLYRAHLSYTGFELTTLLVIGINCIGSLISNLPYDHDQDGHSLSIVINTCNYKHMLYDLNIDDFKSNPLD